MSVVSVSAPPPLSADYFSPRHRQSIQLWYASSATNTERRALNAIVRGVQAHNNNNTNNVGTTRNRDQTVTNLGPMLTTLTQIENADKMNDAAAALTHQFASYVSREYQGPTERWLRSGPQAQREVFEEAMATLVQHLRAGRAAGSTEVGTLISQAAPQGQARQEGVVAGIRHVRVASLSRSASVPVGARKPTTPEEEPPVRASKKFNGLPSPMDRPPAPQLNLTVFMPRAQKSKPSRHLWDGRPPYAKLSGKFEDQTTFNEYFHMTPERGHPLPHIMSKKQPSNRFYAGAAPYARTGGLHETTTSHQDHYKVVPMPAEAAPHVIMSRKRPQRHLYDQPMPYGRFIAVGEDMPPPPQPNDEVLNANPSPKSITNSRFPNVARRLLDGESPYAKLSTFANLTTSNTFSRHYAPGLTADIV